MKVKKSSTIGLVLFLLLLVLFGSLLFITIQHFRVDALVTPRYKMEMTGQLVTNDAGNITTTEISGQDSVEVPNYGNGNGSTKEIYMYLYGTDWEGSAAFLGYINSPKITLSCSSNEGEIALYYDTSDSVILKSHGTLTMTISNGPYRAHLRLAESGNVGETPYSYTLSVDCLFEVDIEQPTLEGASITPTDRYTDTAFTVSASDQRSGIEGLYMKAPNAEVFEKVGSISMTVEEGSANGLYTFFAKDLAGNQSKNYYINYDSNPPTGVILGSDGEIPSGSYTNEGFTFKTEDGGSGIASAQMKSPTSQEWADCSSEVHISADAANGWYYFRSADNTGHSMAEVSVCLDTGVPTGQVYHGTVPVASGSKVKGSFITFAATDTISGMESCYVKVPGNNTFSPYTAGTQYTTDGEYQFYAQDRSQNRSEIYSILLDNGKPIGKVYGGETEKVSGSIVNSEYIKFTATDAISGNAQSYVKHPGSTSYVEYTDGTRLAVDGKYYFYSRDLVGNQSDIYSITLDKTKPVGTIYGGENILESGSKTNAAYIKYVATDEVRVAKCYVRIPGESEFTEYINGSQLSDKDGIYYFYSKDVSGNESAVLSVTLDRTRPVGHLFAGSTEVRNVAFVNAAYIRFSAEDSLSGIAQLYVRMPGDSSYTMYSATTQLTAEGLYSFYAEDEANNRSATYTITLDRTAPIGTLFAGESEIETGSFTNADYVTYTAVDNNNLITYYVKKPNATEFVEFMAGAKFTDEGRYQFLSNDKSGNQSAVVSITLDKTRPVLTVYAGNTIVDNGVKSNADFVKMTATDSISGISRLYVKLPGSSGYVEYTSAAQLTMEGEYNFYGLDAANNASETFSVLLDRTKPTGQLYAATTAVDSGTYTNASYITFSASDNSSGVAVIYVLMPDGSKFIEYTDKTMVAAAGRFEFYAQDESGNKSDHYIIFVDRVAPSTTLFGGNADISGGVTNAEFIRFSASDETGLSGCYVKRPGSHTFVLFDINERFVEDGTYEFYAIDLAQNRSEIRSVMLDKTAPVGQLYAGEDRVENNAITNNDSVWFTASDKLSGLYSLLVKLPGRSEFTIYTSGVRLYDNGYYEFKAIDVSNNASLVYSITLDNITPSGQIYGEEDALESGAVVNKEYLIFTALDATSGISVMYVKINSGEWRAYDGSKIYEEGEMRFYAIDSANNRTEEFTVTNDRTCPAVSLSITGQYTNQDFFASATDSLTGISTFEYRRPNGDWIEYTAGTVISNTSVNGWFYFRCRDGANNESEIVSVCLDTIAPTGQLFVNSSPVENNTYTNQERISFEAYDENIAKCYILEPEASEWKVYTSGALYSISGKFEFYVEDLSGNCSEVYKLVIDRAYKSVTLSSVHNGWTESNVTVSWLNGNPDRDAPIISVTINGRPCSNGYTIYTICGGKYIVESVDLAGNVWTNEFTSRRRNIITDTVNKEWWEAADNTGNYFAFATHNSALQFAMERENAFVRTSIWTNPNEWDTGIMMDAKDSVNAKPGNFFIYKKSGSPENEVAYFTEERINEVMREYAEMRIKHFYYWNGSPSTPADGEDIYSLNTQNIYLGDRIHLSDNNVHYWIDGDAFEGTVYQDGGRHSVVVKDDWGNEASYTIVVVQDCSDIRIAVGQQDFADADMARVYYLKNTVRIEISDAVDDYAMFIIRDSSGNIKRILSLGETYEISAAGKYIVQAINHFGLTEELVIYVSLDVPDITFTEVAAVKQLQVQITPSSDSYAELMSLTIYKSLDGGESWVVLTVDDYGKNISLSSLVYRFRTSGIYRVVIEDVFHTGFEAIELSRGYTQADPTGVLEGVENNGYTNREVTFTWSDEAVVVVKRNGKVMEYISGQKLREDGVYDISFRNFDGYHVEYHFVIDTQAPLISIGSASNGETMNGCAVNCDVIVSSGESGLDFLLYRNGQQLGMYSSGTILTDDGVYRVVVTDLAGNYAELEFTIDKSVDFETDVYANAIVNTATFKANESLLTIAITKDGEAINYEFGSVLTDPGSYTAVLTDELGNSVSLAFFIIQPITGSFSYDFGIVPGIEKISVNGTETALENGRLSLAETGVYEVVVTVAGKGFLFTVTVDATAPTLKLKGVANGGSAKNNVSLVDLSEAAELKVYLDGQEIEYVIGAELTDVGQYRVVLIDPFGNLTEYTFKILRSVNGGIIALIVILSLAVAGAAAFFILKKRGFKFKRGTQDKKINP